MGLSSISIPDVNVNLTRFKEMAKHLLSASWLLISSISVPGVVSTESVSVELTFPDILYNHEIVDDLSFKKTLSVFKFEQVKNFK